jgi:CheY-like chemotaxis protein
MLEKRGFRVDVVGNGLEALEALQRIPYSLVFMDCHMPDMDGYDATRQIRRNEAKAQQHTIVIAMTANALAGDDQKCFAAGMDDYLAKPVTPAQLDLVLGKWSEVVEHGAVQVAHGQAWDGAQNSSVGDQDRVDGIEPAEI